MNYVILTQVGGLLKPFAWIFGVIFNWLYELLTLIGIENIAVTLVLFTVITKMIMLPLTVKQQRFSKLSAKMQPELNAITEKYKGRKDETTQRLMTMEQQRVYEKYGTSPTSGCLPLLITLPIIFAMYRIIYAIPAYVDNINDLYTTIATAAMAQDGYFEFFKNSAETLSISLKKWDEVGSNVFSQVHIIDILTKYGTDDWNSLLSTFPALNTVEITGTIDKINSVFSVFGLNILNSPSYYAKLNGFFNVALWVPVLAVVTQLGSSLLQKAQNKTGNNKKKDDNPMAQSMNSMHYVMPFMSGFFCYGFSLVIGIYWIINTVVSLLQQIFINIYLDHTDMDAYIAKNSEKMAKKREKLGVLQNSNGVSNVAKYQTKSIDYSQPAPVKTTSSYANMSNSSGNSKKKQNQVKDDDVNDNSGNDDVQVKAPEKKSVSAYANLLKRD